MSPPKPRHGSPLLLLPIALIIIALAVLFAWIGGWFGNKNVTPQTMVNTAACRRLQRY